MSVLKILPFAFAAAIVWNCVGTMDNTTNAQSQSTMQSKLLDSALQDSVVLHDSLFKNFPDSICPMRGRGGFKGDHHLRDSLMHDSAFLAKMKMFRDSLRTLDSLAGGHMRGPGMGSHHGGHGHHGR